MHHGVDHAFPDGNTNSVLVVFIEAHRRGQPQYGLFRLIHAFQAGFEQFLDGLCRHAVVFRHKTSGRMSGPRRIVKLIQ